MEETAALEPQSTTDSEGASELPLWTRDAWTHLALTVPIFVLYHLGVALLPIRNAADLVTSELRAIADQNLAAYFALTVALGGSLVAVMYLVGRGGSLKASRFLVVAGEGVAYGIAMRLIGGYALEALPLMNVDAPSVAADGTFASVVMALGAGLYEELLFRVTLFGVGAWMVRSMMGSSATSFLLRASWAIGCAALFSAWHHVGPMGEAFDMRVFAYRAICGLVLTTIYSVRGFAPAVWTHALYDIWALVG